MNNAMQTVRNYGGETVGTAVHAFEIAGLGKAPFRFVGVQKKTYQACHGAPIQPGSSCDFCGNGIMFEYWIRSSDGRDFKVGCDCVAKTSDKGLRRVVDAKRREVECAKTHERQDAKIDAAVEKLDFVAVTLASQPHPYKWQADKGSSMLDRVEWLLANAGRKGKCEAAKIIEAAAKAA